MYSLKFSQRGISLIEILIALALSIIIILAMLRAFVTTGKVTAEASLGAKVDSSIMLGLIATDRILQGIGYGINAPALNTTFKVHRFNNDPTKDIEYLVWKIPAGTCQSLKVSQNNGLYFYGKNSGYACADLDVKSGGTAEPLIFIDNAINDSGISNNINKIGSIKIEVQTVTGCSPFGIKNESVTSLGKYQVLLTANIYAASTDSTARTIRNVTCLFNIK